MFRLVGDTLPAESVEVQTLGGIRDAADILLIGGSMHDADKGVEQISEGVRIAIRKRGAWREEGIQFGTIVQRDSVDIAISKATTEAYDG